MNVLLTRGVISRGILPRGIGQARRSIAVCEGERSYSTRTSTTQSSGNSKALLGAGFAGLTFLAFAASFSNTKLHLEAPPLETNQDVQQSASNDVRLDPATSLPFPLVLPRPQSVLPVGRDELHLVGLGVRTVSFLAIRVYVAALYVDAKSLGNLSALPGWKGFEAKWMMNKTSEDDVHTSETMLSTLLDSGAAFAIRIVPTRSTDYNHLRDGFTRAVQNRAKLARKQKELDAEADEALNKTLQELKDAFPKASLPKGRALDLIFTPSASGLDLTLEEDGKILGRVQAASQTDRRFTLARQLFLAYFANKDEISKPFKQSVAQGLQDRIQA